MAVARTLQLRRTRLEWIARRLALSGCMSRREAITAIEKGAVQVDGRVVTRDVEVCDEATITFHGRPLPPAAACPALFGLIKPPRVAYFAAAYELGRTKPRAGQEGAVQCQKKPDLGGEAAGAARENEEQTRSFHECKQSVSQEEPSMYSSNTSNSSLLHPPGHLIPVNILPVQAEGLVLLTNDGGFAHALQNPTNKIVRAYDFRVSGALPSLVHWRQWALGVQEGGVDYGRVWVQLLRPCPSGAWLRVRLKGQPKWGVKLVEPPNADFRSLLGSCGLKIRRMRLHAFGPYLSSSVPEGCLFPLQIDHALLPLVPRHRPRLMLVPVEGDMQQTLQATEHFKREKGGGFAAARLLKENSVIAKPESAAPR